MSLSVLVTGGAGYIGSHMVKILASSGYDVTVFDNLSRGHRDAIVAGEFHLGDLLNRGDLSEVFGRHRFDMVMHFAALAYVGESVEKPLLYYRNNVTGTLNLLQAMREASVARLVFSSTCATYGMPYEIPVTEGHAQNPVNPYGWSKFFVERILDDCGRAYGLKSISLRYFNAAGCDHEAELAERHDPETHLIPLVLAEASRVRGGGVPEDTSLCVFGDDYNTPDGTCIRDYIHVEDLCSGHLDAAERLMRVGKEGFEAYNLGNGAGFSVKEIIDACRRVTGVDIRYRIADRRQGDPPSLVGSAERAKAVLRWSPRISSIYEIVGTAWNWKGKDR